jgi:predicted MFS family arabinose efflux permease
VAGEGAARLWSRAFVILVAVELAYFIAAAMMIPVIPRYATGPVGAGPAGAGFAFGVFSAAGVLLRLFAGREADRRGRRPLVVGGCLLFAAATALLFLADSLWLLVLLRFVQGAGEAAFFVATFALVVDLAPADRVGEAVSFVSLGLYGGVTIGPLLGEQLLEHSGFGAAWAGAAALALAGALMGTQLPEPTRGAPGSRHRLVHPAAVAPGLGMLAAIAAMAGFLAFVALRADEVGLAGARYVLMLYGVVVIACRVAFAGLPDRVRPLRLMLAALLVSALGLVAAASADSAWALFVGAALVAIGVAFTTPAFFAAVMAGVEPSERGAASGTASLFIDLGFGGGPVVFGLVADAASISAAFVAGAVIALAGAVWTARLSVAAPRLG